MGNYHYYAAWDAFLQGDLPRAERSMQISLDLADLMDFPLARTLARIAMGILAISAVLARVFSTDGAERTAITALVQAEARGDRCPEERAGGRETHPEQRREREDERLRERQPAAAGDQDEGEDDGGDGRGEAHAAGVELHGGFLGVGARRGVSGPDRGRRRGGRGRRRA